MADSKTAVRAAWRAVGWTRKRVLVRCAAAVVLMGLAECADDGPLFQAVLLDYRGPAAGSIPPPTPYDGSCYHHYAPSNLLVSTSWGPQARLEQTGPDTFAYRFTAAPVGEDLWVSFIDITLCPTGSVLVTQGVKANGVGLTRSVVVDGAPRLAFRLERSGQVVP